MFRGWRTVSAVGSTYCSCRGPKLGSKHPQSDSQASDSRSRRHNTSFWPPWAPGRHVVCIHTSRQNTHTHEINLFWKLFVLGLDFNHLLEAVFLIGVLLSHYVYNCLQKTLCWQRALYLSRYIGPRGETSNVGYSHRFTMETSWWDTESVPWAAGQVLCSSPLAPQTEYLAVKID